MCRSSKMKIVFLHKDERIVKVDPEIYGRQVYVAQDIRKDVLVLAQSCPTLSLGIQETTNEDAKLSSLYESATLQLKSGRHGSFQIIRLSFAEFPEWYELHRQRYKRRALVTRNDKKWKREKCEEAKQAVGSDGIDVCD